MKKNSIYCDRCGKEVYPRSLFNLKGRCFKTVVEQRVTSNIYDTFPFTSTKEYDLCYECSIELRKFLGIKENTRIPHVNYRPNNDEVLYLCDRKACDKCSESCHYTSDVNHAVNFHQLEDAVFEIDPMVDTSVAEINEGDDI